MSDERPEYCSICKAPLVWCECAQPQSGDDIEKSKPVGIWDGDPIEHVLRSRIADLDAEIAKRDANIVFLEDQITELTALVQTKATPTHGEGDVLKFVGPASYPDGEMPKTTLEVTNDPSNADAGGLRFYSREPGRTTIDGHPVDGSSRIIYTLGGKPFEDGSGQTLRNGGIDNLRTPVEYELIIKALEAHISNIEADASATCAWVFDDDPDCTFWASSCGLAWYFEDGGPADADCTYCPKCGKRIVVAETPEEEEK